MTIRYLEATRELVVHLKFPDSRKDEVKALGARFNGADKGWYLRADLDPARVAKLEALGFPMPAAWLAVFGGPPDTGPVSAMLSETMAIERPLRGKTMSELTSELKSAVSRAVPESIWVRGSFRPNNGTANNAGFFFAIAEVDAAGRDSVTLQACVWASELERVMRPLRNAGLELTNGLAICARVKVSLSEKRGQVMLSVQEFDPAASLGEIALQRDKVVRALAAEGLAKTALERPLPFLPIRIALVSSVGTDGYTDFRKQLSESGYGFAVADFDVRVQGDALERTVLEAFAAIETQRDQFDLVVVTRGGGGKGDLGSWDNLAVGRAVARCSVKVLVAIGHVNDATALDSIALSLPTPTAAGKFVAERVTQADQRAADAFSKLMVAVLRRLDDEAAEQRALAAAVAEQTGALLEEAQDRLSMAAAAVDIRVSNRVRVASERLATFVRAVERAPLVVRAAGGEVDRNAALISRGTARLLEVRRRQLERANAALLRAAPAAVARAEQRLRMPEMAVRMADPANILRRGFALLRDGEGRVLASASALRVGDALAVQLRDGQLVTRVEAVASYPSQDVTTERKP